ncbi:MAG: hypothetical protein ACJAVI_005479 [Candidatus Azotimanducaceae bacterium]|jgi:hypothetical protein
MKFILVSFQASELPDQITGEIELGAKQLHCKFSLNGKLEAINWQDSIADVENSQDEKPKATTSRTSELWLHSCFELFLGEKGETRYWEINIAPDGRWQCYQFDDVRLGMKESEAFNLDSYVFEQSAKEANLQITLNHQLHNTDTDIQAGISVVLESKTSELHYYALRHCGPKPDFHLRDSHALQLNRDKK